jgi:hypothetical protein
MLSTDADVTVLWDHSSYNAGFLAIKPTKPSIWIYDRVHKMSEEGSTRNDQFALDDCLDRCTRWGLCTVSLLDPKRFLNGQAYFEKGGHTFAGQNPCRECVVVHDNFIVSKGAKIYRLKENHMWLYDQDGYYSSKEHKYLTFLIPVFEKQTTQQYQTALGNALAIGRLLNRIVVLPQFNCAAGVGSCALNSFFKISTFDKQFLNHYRESTFLSNPAVPLEIINSVSSTHYISKSDTHVTHDRGTLIKNTLSNDNTLTSNEILERFQTNNHSVLSLGYLHKLDIIFTDDKQNRDLKTALENAFEKCDYKQFCRSGIF